MAVARVAAAGTSAAWMVRLAVKMMLWLARASLAGCAVRAALAAGGRPASGAVGAAAVAPLPRLRVSPDEAAELPEQPARSRAAPDISPAHIRAVMRSAVPRSPRGKFEARGPHHGPRGARAGAVVFMLLGRTSPGAGFRRSGHVPITDCPPGTRGPGSRARAGE